MKSRIVCLVLLMVTGLGVANAQQRRTPTPYGVLYKQWKSEVKALDAVDPKLSGTEKRERKREINARYTPQFVKLAKRHLNDDLWLQCLIWITVEGVPSKAFDEMFDILRDHAKDVRNTTQLQLLMSEVIKLRSENINPALSVIAKEHGNRHVRGAALYALAARTKRFSEIQGDAHGCIAAEKLLEQVIAEYPDVSTYRGENKENAEQLLAELRSPVALTKKAPATVGETITERAFELGEAIAGKVAVVSFSGHWCGPCVAMHPVQKEIVSTFPEDAVVVEINSDPLDSLDDVREKLAADGLNWIVVADGSNGPISKQWMVTAWPTYFVIDRDGRIRHRVTGNLGRKLLEMVEQFVEEPDQQ